MHDDREGGVLYCERDKSVRRNLSEACTYVQRMWTRSLTIHILMGARKFGVLYYPSWVTVREWMRCMGVVERVRGLGKGVEMFLVCSLV